MGKSGKKGPKTPKEPRSVTDRSRADRDALRDAFADVRPLSERSKKRVMHSSDSRSSERPRPSASHLSIEPLVLERDSDGRVLGRRDKVHGSITDALEDPGLEIQAECDLHGMTVAEADREVLRFVRDHQERGDRWVLIIVGKGLHSAGGKGTLKEHVVGSLSTRGAARYVLAFRTAPMRLGGTGALTVRLVDRL